MNNLERYGRPLVKAIADWERENGSIAAIMPSEYGGFIQPLRYAAMHEGGSARAALDGDAITLYNLDGETIIDMPDHVLLPTGDRYAVLVTLIYDDGEHVGPENTDAVCPNIESALAYVERQFNSDPIRLEREQDDEPDPFAPGRLFFRERDLNQTLCLRLIPWKTA